MQLFLDMDGVLADFDKHHEYVFGYRPDRVADNVDWEAVRRHKDFYLKIPPMVDAEELWKFAKPHNPIVLTGVPWSVEEAADNKRAWVKWYLGPDVPVVTCASKNKCRYAKPGDVLVDDWEKYKDLWIKAGGLWVTHTSAKSSIEALKQLGL